MNTLSNILTAAKSNGFTHIWADCDSIANNGIEWLVRNGYTAKSHEDAASAIEAERKTMGGSSDWTSWIWSIDEEINNASADL